MPEPGDEQLSPTPRNARGDRAEAVATLVALVWASTAAIVFAVYGGNVSLVGVLAISPFIAAAFARPSRVALVGILTAFFALVISTPPHNYGELNHTLRVVTMLAATAVAMWISYLRGQRNVQLWTARSETRNERRRRVAAETAQRMQTMARALTTAADPAQVADAVFAAMRDELRVDASTFALLDDWGALHTLRRFGYAPDDPTDGVLTSLQPDGPVLGDNVAFFAETIDDLQRDRPDISSSLNSDRFRALAIIPLVVSDHTIGAVVVHWDDDREISEPDRTFLFTITGAAAQAVERARLTLTEFVNLERSQHLHQLSSALAAATTPGDVAHAAIAGGRRALGHSPPWCAFPLPVSEVWPVWPAAGTRRSSPVPWCPSRAARRACASRTAGPASPASPATMSVREDVAVEIVRTGLRELPKPVTIVSEPLIGSAGPLGVPFARLRRAARAERAGSALPLHVGWADRAEPGASPGLRTRTRGPAGARGRTRAALPPVRGHQAVELEPGTDDRDPAHHEPGRRPVGRLVFGPSARESGLVRLDVREMSPTRPSWWPPGSRSTSPPLCASPLPASVVWPVWPAAGTRHFSPVPSCPSRAARRACASRTAGPASPAFPTSMTCARTWRWRSWHGSYANSTSR